MSLLETYRNTLRKPGDDKSVFPIEYDPPKIRKLQMKIYYLQKEIEEKKEQIFGAVPTCIIQHRLKRRLLSLPKPDSNNRWIWNRPGYQTYLSTKSEGSLE